MDATDQQLLSLLRQNARTSVAILARKLGVSRGTVSNRITRLEDAGTIVGYTVRLRPDALPQGISAWMSVAVEGNETRAVIASLLGVRRESITEAASKLQLAGCIRYRRVHIAVLDRAGLESRACECYGVVRREWSRLLDRASR